MKTRTTIAVLWAVGLLVGLAGPAHAVVIFSESFESPDVAPDDSDRGDPGFWNTDPTGWAGSGHPSYTGVCDQGSGKFTTPYGDQAVRIGKPPGALTTTSSILSDVLQADTTYTLTFNVARRNDKGDTTYHVELLAGGNVLETAAGTTTQTDMSDAGSLTFTTGPSHALLGQPVAIRLMKGPGGAHYSYHPQYDNLQLDATPSGGGPGPAPVPTVILETDFAGRTVSGATASNITWTTDGVADPGDLTAVPVGGGTFGGLFDTANAQGHFAPDRNTGNEGPWSVDIPLELTAPEVEIQEILLDWQHFNNSGNFQGANRSVDWTATLTGLLSGVVGTKTAFNVNGKSGAQLLAFDTPVTLTNADSWTLQILAEGSNTSGNNTGLDAISVIGLVGADVIPEPATLSLLGLGALLALRRRRRGP